MLYGAHHAQYVIVEFRVQREDLIDCAANERMLPTQMWEIALSLALYSKLCRQEPDHPQGVAQIKMLQDRRCALVVSLRGITCRMRALEDYRQQSAEADARYAELEQIQYLSDRSDQVLDLVARTLRTSTPSRRARARPRRPRPSRTPSNCPARPGSQRR